MSGNNPSSGFPLFSVSKVIQKRQMRPLGGVNVLLSGIAPLEHKDLERISTSLGAVIVDDTCDAHVIVTRTCNTAHYLVSQTQQTRSTLVHQNRCMTNSNASYSGWPCAYKNHTLLATNTNSIQVKSWPVAARTSCTLPSPSCELPKNCARRQKSVQGHLLSHQCLIWASLD